MERDIDLFLDKFVDLVLEIEKFLVEDIEVDWFFDLFILLDMMVLLVMLVDLEFKFLDLVVDLVWGSDVGREEFDFVDVDVEVGGLGVELVLVDWDDGDLVEVGFLVEVEKLELVIVVEDVIILMIEEGVLDWEVEKEG